MFEQHYTTATVSLSSEVSQHRQLSLCQMDASVVVSYSTAKPVATSYLKTISLCTICGYRIGFADDSFPLGSDTVSLGIKFLTF